MNILESDSRRIQNLTLANLGRATGNTFPLVLGAPIVTLTAAEI